MTKERPILFSGSMVNTILAGTKTQTRRVVKPQPVELDEPWPNSDSHNCWHDIQAAPEYHGECGNIPFFNGLRLWVKETACFQLSDKKKEKVICYRAGGDEILASQQWTPSIFMPRWASRITLEIVSVKVERVQGISGPDAIAEGWPREQELYPNLNTSSKAQDWYQRVWDSINGKKHPWKSNPWVWVIEFKQV